MWLNVQNLRSYISLHMAIECNRPGKSMRHFIIEHSVYYLHKIHATYSPRTPLLSNAGMLVFRSLCGLQGRSRQNRFPHLRPNGYPRQVMFLTHNTERKLACRTVGLFNPLLFLDSSLHRRASFVAGFSPTTVNCLSRSRVAHQPNPALQSP
jgi:hypothetical protein